MRWCRRAFTSAARTALISSIQQWEEGSVPDRLIELQGLEAEIRGLEIRLGEWKFQSTMEGRWWSQLTALVADIEALFDEETGLVGDTVAAPFGWGVAKRLEFARVIEKRSLSGDGAQARWKEAIDGVASSPLYGGLQLMPQLGLLPIGSDRESGLWEFAHLQTGVPAVRGDDGELELNEDMGVVLVLIPRGKFMMGAQASELQAQNYDPAATHREYPPHEVELSPYFISKYEMTQGQWQRITGSNPSSYPSILSPQEQLPTIDHSSVDHAAKDPLLYPVHLVQWGECSGWMVRLGLSLPSEAQWERGARAGTTTAWCTGQEPESVLGSGVFDANFGTRVGGYPGNGFGLHDVHGNVVEWCLDGGWEAPYDVDCGVDPVAPGAGTDFREARGGGYKSMAVDARSAHRSRLHFNATQTDLGLRPAQRLRYQ